MFSRDYICLVAGLREYTLESDSKGLDLDALLEEIFEEISKRDAAAVRILYGYYDCENLASAYAGRKSHNPMGLISSEMIEAIIRGEQSSDEDPMELLPSEVARVVESYTSKGNDVVADNDGNVGFDRALFGAYYEACAKSKSRFLRSWSEADRNLRNVAAALTARSTERPIEDVVVGGGDVVDQLLRSSAVDFGLKGDLSYIDAVIGAVSDEPNMVDKEHKIDQVRWEVVDELVEQEYFSADYVLGYLVKVNIVARWRMLDPVRGREMFAKLMSGLNGSDLIDNK